MHRFYMYYYSTDWLQHIDKTSFALMTVFDRPITNHGFSPYVGV